jgi:ATP-dependent Clp protease ATP-binding subunit ClpB
MTSNIGGQAILEQGTEDWARVEESVTRALRAHFKPEFLNRVDDIIVFHPLGEAEITHIVDLQLGRMEKLLAEKKLTLEVTPAAKALLARDGYDPAYGARPLKRTIQRLIQDPLALHLLNGDFAEGDTVVVDAKRGQIGFRKAVEAHPV